MIFCRLQIILHNIVCRISKLHHSANTFCVFNSYRHVGLQGGAGLDSGRITGGGLLYINSIDGTEWNLKIS